MTNFFNLVDLHFWSIWTFSAHSSLCAHQRPPTETNPIPDNPPDCFQRNKLFVEDSLPVPLTLTDCQRSCQSSSSCKFFTYSSPARRCGLRFYHPSATAFSPGQQSGTTNLILPSGLVFVGRSEFNLNPFECQIACQHDPNCFSVTYTGFFSGKQD